MDCIHTDKLEYFIFTQNRSVSMVDMYIDNTEPSENVGQIHFSLEYDFQTSTLILKIIQVNLKFKKEKFYFITKFDTFKIIG